MVLFFNVLEWRFKFWYIFCNLGKNKEIKNPDFYVKSGIGALISE